MNNIELMKKVIELDTQKLTSRQQSQRVMVQIAIIRKAFNVKNTETDIPVKNFEREIVLTNDEITKEFNQYVGFWEWAKNTNNEDKESEYKNSVQYFIDAVQFFNTDLAESFQNNFNNLLNNLEVA